MGSRLKRHAVLAACLLAAVAFGAAARAGTAPSAIDAGALRSRLEPSVCRVTAENEWGVPLAMASGFVLGNGRFIITDLGVLSQPGVARVAIRYADGSRAAAQQFGFAHPPTGVAAVEVEPAASSRSGLVLAKDPPPTDSSADVAAIGWKWGRDLTLATGRLTAGPRLQDLAPRAVRDPAEAEVTLLRMTGPGLALATAAPVVDAEGTVLAVRVEVLGRDAVVPVAVPAASLRKVLLDASTELKGLKDLPKPLWPAPALRLEGEPPASADFSQLVKGIRTGMACEVCGGDGEIDAEEAWRRMRRDDRPPRQAIGPRRWPGVWDRKVRCPACGGEKIACTDSAYGRLAEMAAQCTRAAWAPGLEGRVRSAIRSEGLSLLPDLAQAGQRFRGELGRRGAQGLRGPLGDGGRGVIVYARVRETIDGPDGRYTLLECPDGGPLVAASAPTVATFWSPGAVGTPKELKAATWVVLGGVAQVRVRLSQGEATYVLPFGWAGAPDPSAAGATR